MSVRKSGLLATVLGVLTAVSVMAAQASTPLAPAKPAAAPAKVAAPAVTIKLGDAILEEYHGGNPADRTTILRDGDVAQKVKTADSGKKRS